MGRLVIRSSPGGGWSLSPPPTGEVSPGSEAHFIPAPLAERSPIFRRMFPPSARGYGKKLIRVIGHSDENESARRLGELRRGQPGDVTLRNLLGTLTAKLELCSRLPVFEWEADREGCFESATAFHALAEAERQSCDAVIHHLREHLDRHVPMPGSPS